VLIPYTASPTRNGFGAASPNCSRKKSFPLCKHILEIFAGLRRITEPVCTSRCACKPQTQPCKCLPDKSASLEPVCISRILDLPRANNSCHKIKSAQCENIVNMPNVYHLTYIMSWSEPFMCTVCIRHFWQGDHQHTVICSVYSYFWPNLP